MRHFLSSPCVRFDVNASKRIREINRRGQSYRATDIGRASAKLPASVLECLGFQTDAEQKMTTRTALRAVAWAALAGLTCKEPRGFFDPDIKRLAREDRRPPAGLPGVFCFQERAVGSPTRGCQSL